MFFCKKSITLIRQIIMRFEVCYYLYVVKKFSVVHFVLLFFFLYSFIFILFFCTFYSSCILIFLSCFVHSKIFQHVFRKLLIMTISIDKCTNVVIKRWQIYGIPGSSSGRAPRSFTIRSTAPAGLEAWSKLKRFIIGRYLIALTYIVELHCLINWFPKIRYDELFPLFSAFACVNRKHKYTRTF